MDMLQDRRGASVTTAMGPMLSLRRFDFTETMGSGFSGSVEMLSPIPSISPLTLLGTPLTITLDTMVGTREFNTFVSRFENLGMLGDKHLYKAHLASWTALLGNSQTSRIFRGKTAKEIIEHVVGLTPWADYLDIEALNDTYRVREMCVQYNESDEDFIFRLISEEGMASHFVHTAEKHTLVLSDWSDGFELFPGYEILDYFPPDRQMRADGECISSWSRSDCIVPGSFVVRDYDWRRPGALTGAGTSQQIGHPNDDGVKIVWPGGYKVQSDGERLAKVGRETEQSGRALVFGGSDARGLSAGHKVGVKGFGAPGHDGDYLITEVTHEFQASDYASVTGGASGGGSEGYHNHFKAQNPETLYRPEGAYPKPVISGIQTAVVAGPSGEEIWVGQGDAEAEGALGGEGHPCVILHFHWDGYGGGADGFPKAEGQDANPDEHSSGWVRVAQGMAGSGWGMQFVPRVGQEVVVQFLDGDPDHPLITGAVYNGANKAPFELPANKTQSGIRTQSSKGGQGFNQIVFEDKKGEEYIHTVAEKDMIVDVKNDRHMNIGANLIRTVHADEATEVTGNRQVVVKKDETTQVDGSRWVEAGGDLSLDAAGGMVIASGHWGEASAQKGEIIIDAKTQITLRCGDAVIQMQANGLISINGKQIQNIAEGDNVIQGAMVTLN